MMPSTAALWRRGTRRAPSRSRRKRRKRRRRRPVPWRARRPITATRTPAVLTTRRRYLRHLVASVHPELGSWPRAARRLACRHPPASSVARYATSTTAAPPAPRRTAKPSLSALPRAMQPTPTRPVCSTASLSVHARARARIAAKRRTRAARANPSASEASSATWRRASAPTTARERNTLPHAHTACPVTRVALNYSSMRGDRVRQARAYPGWVSCEQRDHANIRLRLPTKCQMWHDPGAPCGLTPLGRARYPGVSECMLP
mmetsp:Transcript_30838/g.69635  ORF Transcript_30838/g.69635 Transcript_30838/m.69635 type:complete len:261 (+) Transcript_30838:659-1441(+)